MAYDQELDEFDALDIMTVAEYMEDIEDHNLIDYDGYGYPVRDGLYDSSTKIYPSVMGQDIPSDADHILWLNR